MINIIAGQGDAYGIYEHFKRYFATAAGLEYFSSSDEGWACTDLLRDIEAAAKNAPTFLSAIYDAIEDLRPRGSHDLPQVEDINSICRDTGVGFEVHPPEIVASNIVILQAISNAARTANAVLLQARELYSSQPEVASRDLPDFFDVAITVAGPERELARTLTRSLEEAGIAVFYDELYPEHLWGENLSDMFDQIFRQRARFCAMFVSRAYAAREWTNHERQSALARALKERGNAYILPIRVDDTELRGLPPTVGYVSLQEVGIDRIAELLIKKVRHARSRGA